MTEVKLVITHISRSFGSLSWYVPLFDPFSSIPIHVVWFQMWPQCVHCGASWQNMGPVLEPSKQLCGTDQCNTGSLRGEHAVQPKTIRHRQATMYDVLLDKHPDQLATTPLTTQCLQSSKDTMRAIVQINKGIRDGVAVHIRVITSTFINGLKFFSCIILQYRLSSAPKQIAETYGSSKLPLPADWTLCGTLWSFLPLCFTN